MKTITKVWEDAVVAANVCKKKIVEVGMREELSVCEAPIMKLSGNQILTFQFQSW